MNKFIPTKKTCPLCGKEFTQERWTQKYCHECGKTRPYNATRSNSREERARRWQEKHNPTPGFCQRCGAPISRHSLVCKDCGRKHGDLDSATGKPRTRECEICHEGFEPQARAEKFCPKCKATPNLVEAHRHYTKFATLATHLVLRNVNYPPAILVAQREFEYYRDLTVRRNLAEQARMKALYDSELANDSEQTPNSERTQP